jgi:hypothetical protein
MPEADRAYQMIRHAEARRRRDAAPLGSDEYRDASIEIAAIEIAIAAMEEPPSDLAQAAAAPSPDREPQSGP